MAEFFDKWKYSVFFLVNREGSGIRKGGCLAAGDLKRRIARIGLTLFIDLLLGRPKG